jgi:hypothetical protein
VRPALVVVVAASALIASIGGACTADDAAVDPAGSTTTGGGGGGDGGGLLVAASSGGPPPADAELCGNQIHDVAFAAPALYFVLDASGSMADTLDDGRSRYRVLHTAAVDLVARLGDRARVGAAVFPRAATGDACAAGAEVMPVTRGDPVDGPQPGPTTVAFGEATDVEPSGGTPTAATLVAVREALAGVDGRRAVVLVTDGGPNCNADLACGATTCIPNVEGQCPSEYENCCDPELGGTTDNCLDRAATLEAVIALRDEGIGVHVIGIAGSAPFAATLGQMAILGGAPTGEPPFYYEADDVDALTDALRAIAVVNGSCDFALDDPPDVTWRTNVWLDDALVPYDPVDGWMWRGAPLDYVPRPPPGASAAAAGGGGGAGPGGAGAGDGGAAAGGDGAAGSGGAGPGHGGGASAGGDEGGAAAGAGGGPEVDTSAVELRGAACERFRSGEVRRVQIVTGCPITTPN